ncbi:uncharacterized protein B0H18DRAFT_78833 [Fomitopsis serialis]|uniref:uncharacterized protein n=1 Tax=Fomitopsis serialis TaxID=139415 RepID=UPI002007F95D|nr:uncharacterized protein B0H18DRAFT_78833 [Neoantrodia serialis]KAH9915879.1 hypothetical protein B0H18DRAFT_78833 [Neoantrodia serialis]
MAPSPEPRVYTQTIRSTQGASPQASGPAHNGHHNELRRSVLRPRETDVDTNTPFRQVNGRSAPHTSADGGCDRSRALRRRVQIAYLRDLARSMELGRLSRLLFLRFGGVRREVGVVEVRTSPCTCGKTIWRPPAPWRIRRFFFVLVLYSSCSDYFYFSTSLLFPFDVDLVLLNYLSWSHPRSTRQDALSSGVHGLLFITSPLVLYLSVKASRLCIYSSWWLNQNGDAFLFASFSPSLSLSPPVTSVSVVKLIRGTGMSCRLMADDR